MTRRAHSVGNGIAGIETFIDMDLSEENGPHIDDTDAGKFLLEIRDSIRDVRLTEQLLGLRGKLGGAYHLRRALRALAETELGFEYLWALVGLDALYRMEEKPGRLPQLVGMLPDAVPPQRAARFLNDVTTCYLQGLDTQCIITCRAVVEVLVEELGADSVDKSLGKAIVQLHRDKRISTDQQHDMLEINRQAREVIHDEVGRQQPSADDCVLRVTRLLAQLRPAGWAAA